MTVLEPLDAGAVNDAPPHVVDSFGASESVTHVRAPPGLSVTTIPVRLTSPSFVTVAVTGIVSPSSNLTRCGSLSTSIDGLIMVNCSVSESLVLPIW